MSRTRWSLALLVLAAASPLETAVAQRMQLESLQSRIISHIKIKALNLAQTEFVDLLRRITQTIQRPLAGGAANGPGSAAARPTPAAPGAAAAARFAGTT